MKLVGSVLRLIGGVIVLTGYLIWWNAQNAIQRLLRHMEIRRLEKQFRHK